jgi:2-octaprenyl-6-methoxyphenol hydroxylase
MASNPEASRAIVVGAGPAGLTAAIALACGGIGTTLVGRRAPRDNRTTALLGGSVTALDTLGVWGYAREHAAPLRTLRIVDDTSRLLRAPEARFESDELGLNSFGENIENRHLLAALERRAASLMNLQHIEQDATAIDIDADQITVRLANGEAVTAALVIGADGRKSLCRSAAGIETHGWDYPQAALTVTIAHSRPHHDISTEFHTASGPFTLVPLRGNRSSIVCVVDPADGERLRALDTDALALEIERRSHSILGRVQPEPGLGYFPLAVETARSFAAKRIALVGEAGHRIPPIGAQGLNLGLRDAALIAELAAQARTEGRDIGGDDVLAHYDRERRADVSSRTLAVDLLNRTLLSGFLPFQGARGLGVFLMNTVGPLRRAMMREGIAPSSAQPRLMRGETLAPH